MATTYNNLYLDLRTELRRAGDEEATQSARELVCAAAAKTREELVRDGFGVSFLYEAVVKGRADLAQFTCPPLTGTHEFNVVYLKNTGAGEIAQRFLAQPEHAGRIPH